MNFIHVPPACAFQNMPIRLQVLLPDAEEVLPRLTLCSGAKTVRLFPFDGYVGSESYTLFSAELPREWMQGEQLEYYFTCEKEESEHYVLPLLPKADLPPLIITENAPWNRREGCYVELQNIGDTALDLFDFELQLREDNGLCGRNPLAPAKGKFLLPAGERCILRFLSPNTVNGAKKPMTEITRESFFAQIESDYPESFGGVSNGDLLLFDMPLCDESGQLPEGCFEIYRKYRPHILALTYRGEPFENAFYRIELCRKKGEHHVRRDHVSLWKFNPQTPGCGQCITALARPTPGYADIYENTFDKEDNLLPAVLQISPAGNCRRNDGNILFRFAVFGENIGAAALHLLCENGEQTFVALPDDDGFYALTLPANVTDFYSKLNWYFTVSGGFYTASLGTAEQPRTTEIVDNAGPRLLSSYPAEEQVLEEDDSQTFRFRYRDISGVNGRICILCLDGISVTADTVFGETEAIFTPKKQLAPGKHTFEITLRDKPGNRTYKMIPFAVGGEMQLFRGQVHSHTDESDGIGSPQEAYTYAKEKGGVDFFAVTDHSHYMSEGDFATQRELADKFEEPLRYAPIPGFEMTWRETNGYWGHSNVLNTDWIDCIPNQEDLPGYYEHLAADENAVAMFNHPDDYWGDFDRFAPPADERVRERMALIEIRGIKHDAGYALALTKGWRVGPLYNEDNHKKKWTTASGAMGYVLAPALTRANILGAFRRRRSYSTQDAELRMLFQINGKWMGDILQNPRSLQVQAELCTENPNGIGRLEIVSEDNVVVAAVNAGALREFSWQVELDPDFDYYYLRVKNGKYYSVTAPVFVKGRDFFNIKEMTVGLSDTDEDRHAVRVTVQNECEKALSDASVDFYLSSPDGVILREDSPYCTVHLGKLAPGESRAVTRAFPNVIGRSRVTAVVSASCGGERYADICYRHLAAALFTKVTPLSSHLEKEGETFENPFPYVELYNPGTADLPLKNYILRIWDGCGLTPKPERTVNLDRALLPAGGCLTVWCRQNENLTAEDFNAHYGSSLVEGQNLFITAVPLLSPKPACQKVELCRGEELVARADYGGYCGRNKEIIADEPFLYAADSNYYPDEICLPPLPEGKCLPGRILPSQQLPRFPTAVRPEEENEEKISENRKRVLTKLTHASLVPIKAAALVLDSFSTFKNILKD